MSTPVLETVGSAITDGDTSNCSFKVYTKCKKRNGYTVLYHNPDKEGDLLWPNPIFCDHTTIHGSVPNNPAI